MTGPLALVCAGMGCEDQAAPKKFFRGPAKERDR
jgi:hypothetical protein